MKRLCLLLLLLPPLAAAAAPAAAPATVAAPAAPPATSAPAAPAAAPAPSPRHACPPQDGDSDAIAAMGMRTGVQISLGFFGCLILTMGAAFGYRAHRDRQLHETLRLLVQKGDPIPPELLSPRAPAHADLRRGLVLTACGLGLSLVLRLLPDMPAGMWSIGLLLILVGGAYALTWWLAGRPRERGARGG